MEFVFVGPRIGRFFVLVMLEQGGRLETAVAVVFLNGVGEDLHQLRVGEEWNSVVHGGSSHAVVVFQSLRLVGRDVDNHANVTALDEFGSVGLVGVFVRWVGNHGAGDLVLLHHLGGGLGGEQGVALFDQLPGTVGEFVLQRILNRNQDVLLGHFETGGKHGLQEGLLPGLSEAGNLTGGSHLYAEDRIGTSETGEREHGSLDTNIFRGTISGFKGGQIHVGRVFVDHGTGGGLDKINSHGLGDERERSGCTNVCLDTHNIGALSNKLDVDGSRDVQALDDLLCGITNSVLGVVREGLGGKNQSGVTGVNSGVFDVLVNGSSDDFAVLTNTVEFDFGRSFDEIRNNDGVIL
mmetsp:Transcript_18268/g.37428  ORF Transcript_18268/g.37428 Transcript_18268/m.37428 type:complete len:351 (-) Transcript_18268:969-2021(-)